MSFEKDLVGLQRYLLGYAINLSHSKTEAEDLVQDTMLIALKYRSQFQEGTNLRAWTTVILRNTFLDRKRKYKREVWDGDGFHRDSVRVSERQEWYVRLLELDDAIAKLSDVQFAALYRIAFYGDDYESAARELGCAVGTVKSRVNRARKRLEEEHAPD